LVHASGPRFRFDERVLPVLGNDEKICLRRIAARAHGAHLSRLPLLPREEILDHPARRQASARISFSASLAYRNDREVSFLREMALEDLPHGRVRLLRLREEHHAGGIAIEPVVETDVLELLLQERVE